MHINLKYKTPINKYVYINGRSNGNENNNLK